MESLPRVYIAAVAASRESSTGSSYTTPDRLLFQGTFSSVWIPDHRTRRFSPPSPLSLSITLSLIFSFAHSYTSHPLPLFLSLFLFLSLSLSLSPSLFLLQLLSVFLVSPLISPYLSLSLSLFVSLSLSSLSLVLSSCCPLGSIRAHASLLPASPFSPPLSQSTASRPCLLVTWPRVIVYQRS